MADDDLVYELDRALGEAKLPEKVFSDLCEAAEKVALDWVNDAETEAYQDGFQAGEGQAEEWFGPQSLAAEKLVEIHSLLKDGDVSEAIIQLERQVGDMGVHL